MYIEQFKQYSRSITNPNIRIDSLQIESVKVEMHIMNMEYNLDAKNLENHEHICFQKFTYFLKLVFPVLKFL